jgi:hypothetical protein
MTSRAKSSKRVRSAGLLDGADIARVALRSLYAAPIERLRAALERNAIDEHTARALLAAAESSVA